MSGLAKKLIASAGGEEKQYVDDVFSTYLYTGNGSTQTINNGIDLAGEGGLVWFKNRGAVGHHILYDTVRGADSFLMTSLTNAQATDTVGYKFNSFNSNGFSLYPDDGSALNATGNTYASWSFRRAPKFFDVVTYTTVAGAMTIPHSLGQEVGMWVIKATNAVDSWWVHHRSIPTSLLRLNGTSAVEPSFSTATSTNITISNGVFAAGTQIVIYLFAHDTSADGIIQCGSFTTDASGNATVNLGWEPQFLLVKNSSGTADNWKVFDVMRSFVATPSGNVQARLFPNTSDPETSEQRYEPLSTGFRTVGTAASTTFIYLAIRRPNKPPTSGSQVYSVSSAAGNVAVTTGFPVDLSMTALRSGDSSNVMFRDRLRGLAYMTSSSTTAETAYSAIAGYSNFASNTKIDNSVYGSSTAVWWSLSRATGFFDVVCYTGTGVAGTVNHNLGAVPELMIVKRRNGAAIDWAVYSQATGPTGVLLLNTTNGFITFSPAWNDTAPGASSFTVGTAGETNNSANTYVAYLFASLPGISRISSYTGNGTTQTINCGFTTGARFVLIKRTDSTGDWYVWDTTRGIVADNDPHLSLNTTAAEVTTDDSVDPESSGFIVNQNTATNINVNGGSYIFLAIA